MGQGVLRDASSAIKIHVRETLEGIMDPSYQETVSVSRMPREYVCIDGEGDGGVAGVYEIKLCSDGRIRD